MTAADPTPPMSAEEMRAEIERLNALSDEAALEAAMAIIFEDRRDARIRAAEHRARASDLARRLEQQEKSR